MTSVTNQIMAPWLLLVVLLSGPQVALASADCWTPQEGVAIYEDGENATIFDTCNVTTTQCPPPGEVTICPNVTIIPLCSFAGCNRITLLNISDSVTEIGVAAFENNQDSVPCSGSVFSEQLNDTISSCGVQEIVFGSSPSLMRIGEAAFKFNEQLREVNLPDSVTVIGPEAFEYCDDLAAVNVGSGVEVIGRQAFKETGLTEFVMPHSVHNVGDYAFYYCDDMALLSLSNQLAAIPSGFSAHCYSLTSIDIPDSVTEIGQNAFYYCDSMETATFGPNSSLEVIGKQAFKESGLVTFVMPDSVHSVGPWTFGESESLLSITLSNRLTAIPYRFCHDCESLTGIHIPDSVTEIGGEAFEYCYDLFNLTLPNNLTHIPHEFCQECAITSLHIPDSVVYIGGEAFDRCSSLVEVTFGSRVRTLGSQAFKDCGSLTNISLPDSVELIGEEAFEDLGYYYDDVVVTLGAGVRQIGESAFRDSPIHEIIFPDGLRRIGRSAFQDTELTDVTIPASVSVVEGRAFLVTHHLDYCEQGENVSYEECVDDPSEGGSCPDWEDVQDAASEGSSGDECEAWLAVADSASYPSGPCCACGGGRIEPSEPPYDRDLTSICLSSFDCSGSLYINETVENELDDCFRGTRRVTVDTSHCGFVTTPDIYIFDANLVVYNCSHVVNPSPVSFEMWCTVEPDFPDFGGSARRLSDFYYYDDDKVVTWGASEPAFVDECNGNIDDLNDRISELEDTLDNLRTTVTTTTTAVSATTVTTATQSTVTATTGTATTTTVPVATASVLAAGVATDCKSLLGFLIASLVVNAILMLLLLFVFCALQRLPGAPKPDQSQQQNMLNYDLDAASRPVSAAGRSEPSYAASNALSAGTSAGAGEVPGATQATSDSWAGRSVIYRYLRRGPRSGNDIEAKSRRGWKMNTVEPPNMEDPQSAANSRATGAASRSTKGVSFAPGAGAGSASAGSASASAGGGVLLGSHSAGTSKAQPSASSADQGAQSSQDWTAPAPPAQDMV